MIQCLANAPVPERFDLERVEPDVDLLTWVAYDAGVPAELQLLHALGGNVGGEIDLSFHERGHAGRRLRDRPVHERAEVRLSAPVPLVCLERHLHVTLPAGKTIGAGAVRLACELLLTDRLKVLRGDNRA